jgi:hypothetical protein
MAELKRRLDIGAREYEKLATDASAKAGALLEAAPAESAAAPDEATLSAALSAAQRRVDRLADMAEQATAAQARAAQAQAKLATVEREDVAALELACRNAEVNAVNRRVPRGKAEGGIQRSGGTLTRMRLRKSLYAKHGWNPPGKPTRSARNWSNRLPSP